MTASEADAEASHSRVNLDNGNGNGPDRYLQHAVGADAHSRKHSRSSTIEEFDYWSDESGRFDDAEEGEKYHTSPDHRSPSTHSAKRRRSNDWPLEEANSRKETTTHRWPFYNRNASHGSPRRYGRQGGSSRARRSRFVEATMNDSVSEKPPSIFIRDESEGVNGGSGGQRQSGIFRFGKAIASAFNPFGVWGNVSEIWRNSNSQAENRYENDTKAQAGRAYAELKKAGYQGTVKGSYLRGARTDPNIADQTWRSIQEKMEYKSGGNHSRHSSMGAGSSIRHSFQEIRKAKSLGLIKRGSLDVENEVRKQKSRKELQKQAKLLKRVSNLEEKLDRARRELRELTSECEDETDETPVRTVCQEKPYHRKFVPGALPSLPSERFYDLENHWTAPDLQAEDPTPLASLSEIIQRIADNERSGQHDMTAKRSSTPTSPKPAKESQTPSSLTADSPSHKRKSPNPEAVARVKASQTDQEDSTTRGDRNDKLANFDDETNDSRMVKLPKMDKCDSPRSVGRKKSKDQLKSEDESEERGRKHSPARISVGKRSPSSRGRRRTSSNSRNRIVTPYLRTKKGQTDLRPASVGQHHSTDQDKENTHLDPDQEDLNVTIPTPTPTPSKGREYTEYTHDYIPPVPPLPKNLAAAAAKVDRRLAKEIGKRRNMNFRKLQTQTHEEEYEWPDGFF